MLSCSAPYAGLILGWQLKPSKMVAHMSNGLPGPVARRLWDECGRAVGMRILAVEMAIDFEPARRHVPMPLPQPLRDNDIKGRAYKFLTGKAE